MTTARSRPAKQHRRALRRHSKSASKVRNDTLLRFAKFVVRRRATEELGITMGDFKKFGIGPAGVEQLLSMGILEPRYIYLIGKVQLTQIVKRFDKTSTAGWRKFLMGRHPAHVPQQLILGLRRLTT